MHPSLFQMMEKKVWRHIKNRDTIKLPQCSALTHLFFISLADEKATVESKISLHQKDESIEERSRKESILLSKSDDTTTIKQQNDITTGHQQEETTNIIGRGKRKWN